jgi:hypothetical protein
MSFFSLMTLKELVSKLRSIQKEIARVMSNDTVSISVAPNLFLCDLVEKSELIEDNVKVLCL